MTWQLVRFGDFVDLNPQVSVERGSTYPYVEMASIEPGTRYVEATQSRTPSTGSRFLAGDTLFARITPCLENGKIAQFRAEPGSIGLGSTEFWVLRARPGISDPGYVYYIATTPAVRGPATASMVGASGRQRANLAAVADLTLSVPDLLTQIRVAEALSGFDDLIDVNRRRIELLEHAAQLLYTRWFVDFRFPGHETGPVTETSLGLVPATWPIRPLGELVAFDPRTAVPKEGLKPYVPMQALSERSMIISGVEERDGNAGAKFRTGDTLLARITPSLENGKTGYVSFLPGARTAFGSTEFIVLRPITVSPEWVYLLARSDRLRDTAIKSMSGASGRQRVRREALEALNVPVAPAPLMDQFTALVRPMFELVQSLAVTNAVLQETRDLLLPKLVTGELDLGDSPVHDGRPPR